MLVIVTKSDPAHTHPAERAELGATTVSLHRSNHRAWLIQMQITFSQQVRLTQYETLKDF